VTLLFNANLSFRLVSSTPPLFPGSRHVRDVGLARADDRTIWEFAKREGFTIVTFDSDFHERSLLAGWPPKVIWLRTGNTATAAIRTLLSSRIQDINTFLSEGDHAYLVISE
jgi:predicted nuclease of predicted toxin-antitoxin system